MKNEELLKIAKKKYPPGTMVKCLCSNLICTIESEFYIDCDQTMTARVLELTEGIIKIRDEYNNWAIILNPSIEMVEKRFPEGSEITNKYIENSFIMGDNIEINEDSIYLKTKINTRYTLWDTKNGWATLSNNGKEIVPILKIGDEVIIKEVQRHFSYEQDNIGKKGIISDIDNLDNIYYVKFSEDLSRWYLKDSLELVRYHSLRADDGKDTIKEQNQYVYKKGDLVKIVKKSEEEKDMWVGISMDETIGKIGKVNQISKSLYSSSSRIEVSFGRKSFWYFSTSLELVQTDIDKNLPVPNDYKISSLEHSNGIKSNTEHQIFIRIKPVKINYKPKSVKLSWEEQ